ncbi:hypothetical protein Mpsy_2786 [Methanolobus psychrophilus R15]|nr:hypothetical protein Mpsy_2786 [Methanolobus psychrophilus R15]
MKLEEFKDWSVELVNEKRDVLEAIQKSGSPIEKALVETVLKHAGVQA